MENNFTMEILLLTNSKFSKREYVEGSIHPSTLSPQQNKLADACWNGLVPAILPELFEGISNKDVTMWQLEEGSKCLYMQIGQQHMVPEPLFGLHPWLLFESSCQN